MATDRVRVLGSAGRARGVAQADGELTSEYACSSPEGASKRARPSRAHESGALTQ